MNDIQNMALSKALKTLSALNCTYAIIDGSKTLHGNPLGILDELGATYAVIDNDGVRHGLVSAVLEKMQCKYKITTKDGSTYSNARTQKQAKENSTKREFPYGEIRSYIKTHIENMQVGDVVSIPAMHYGLRNIQNSVTSWFVTNHGKQTCTTGQNPTTNTVDVLRIG